MKQELRKYAAFTYRYMRYLIKKGLTKYDIYTDEECIEKIVNEKKSIARYGDGEFKWILGIKQNSFEKGSQKLAKELKQIIEEDNENLIVGITHSMFTLKNYNYEAKNYWCRFLEQYIKDIKQIVRYDKKYCDASITRPYIDYKSKKGCAKKFANLKKIWDKKHILIVEGRYTRLGVTNDFFDNSKKINRILCPEKNAYAKVDEIEKEIIKNYKKGMIVLISLGPTATVLASRLSKKNIQTIDIGHIDVEYEWFLNNATEKINIPGKYVNESKEVFVEDEQLDLKKYEKQIISKIELK